MTFIVLIGNCNCQNQYFEPKGIVERTEEYKSCEESWIVLKDKERADGYTRIGDSIFGGEIACNVKPLNNIDIGSFRVLAGTKYARDKKHIYYPIEITCIDYEDCGVCYYEKYIVKNAIPETFRYLGKEYSTDGQNIYFRGELIPGADGKTFKVINGPEYFFFGTDKNHVYNHNNKFKNADPLTFYYDRNDSRNVCSEFDIKYVIGDKNKEWLFIPPKTIKEIEKE